MAIAESYYYSGQGEVLLATRDANGEPEGLRKVGNVSELTLSFETELFEHRQQQDGTRTIDLTIVQEITATLQMTMESLDHENLAVALFGSSSEIASGTAVVKRFDPVAALDLWFPLGDINLSAVNSVTQDPDGTPVTLTEGTDYEVDLKFGMIMFLSSGSVTTSDTVDVDYDYDAYKDVQAVESGSSPQRWMRFNGLNTADNDKPVVVDVFKGAVQPLSELGLINEEMAQMQVEMDVLSDALRDTGSKFFQVKQVQA